MRKDLANDLEGEFSVGLEKEDQKEFVYLHWAPGFLPDFLKRLVDSGIKAIVIEGYHSGTIHACTQEEHPDCSENSIPFLQYAREMEVPVFLTFGYMVGDEDGKYGYEPFDKAKGGYETSGRTISAGIIPLKANWLQVQEVSQKLHEILKQSDNYHEIIQSMYDAFPFKSPLNKIQASMTS